MTQRSRRLIWWLVAAVSAPAIISFPTEARGTSVDGWQLTDSTKTSNSIINRLNHHRITTASRIHEVGMIPISMSLPGTVQSGAAFNVSVTVESVPSGGGYVQIGCDNPDLLTSPSGSWPYYLQYAAGASTTATFCVQTSSIADATVTVCGCATDADPSDPSQWSVDGAVLVTP